MYVYVLYIYIYISVPRPAFQKPQPAVLASVCLSESACVRVFGRFPKFHRVFWGRDPGTLKSDIVSKKHPQLICSDLRLSN